MSGLQMKAEQKNVNDIRHQRMIYVFYFFLVCSFFIILRLFYLQVESAETLKNLGECNFLRTEIVPPLRGNFLDCKNKILAANRPVFDIYWQGLGSQFLRQEHSDLLQQVGLILGKELCTPDLLLSIRHAERHARRTILARDISFQTLCQIHERHPYASNILVENRFKRVYPFKSFASHLLGYLSRIENCGKYGLELIFEDQLQGESGYITKITNSRGKSLSYKEIKNPRSGNSIKLTIDFKLQQLAETILDSDQSGCVLVMEPETGAIRAMASFPSFDPNFFLNSITQQQWQEKMSLGNPLLNRICSAEYPPASVFKVVTFAAGLEEGIVDVESIISCKGYVRFCGRNYYCNRHTGHGKLSLKDAFAKSCNIQCFEIAKKIKIDDLADYASRFGLGQKTSFLLPEKTGLVPTTLWKRAIKQEPWWKGETLSASIGQSYLLVTPLQIARMTNAIFTGYLVKPRILESEPIEREKLHIAEQTRAFLREAMKETVNSGTGWRLKSFQDFELSIKTGTAQTCALHHEKTSRHQLEHAWLIGHFSYKGKKPLSLVILIENMGSSGPAIIATKKFMHGYEKIMNSMSA